MFQARYKVLLPQLNEANPNALLLLENDMDSDYYRYMCQLVSDFMRTNLGKYSAEMHVSYDEI